jgi:DNA-binding CsgD family transcriptional regulator
MRRLKGKDVDDVINLMQLCPASLKTKESVTRLFQETRKVFDSDELVFLYPNTQTYGIDLTRSFSLQGNKTFLSRYADYFWRFDPLYDAELNSDNNALAFRTQDVLPYKNFIKLEYYYNFLQPQNLFSELVIRLCFKSFFLGAISLLRSKNKPVFDKNDIRKAELLIPYIVNTVDVGDSLSKNHEEQKLFERWLESQSEGIVLLDSDFHTLYFNSKADSFCILMTDGKTSIAPDNEPRSIYLPDVILQDCRCLARSHQSKNSAYGYDNRIVNLANRRRYHIQYFMFAPAAAENAKPGFTIIINDLNRYSDDAEEIILGQAKLSNREALVARYAGIGWTNKEIADNVHSSPFTVQNQLKKVFEKTGLKNRTQLANLMKYSDGISEGK